MKKILILAMSCNEEFFVNEELMIRTESYARHILAGRYSSVDFWTYTASTDGHVHVSKKNHKIAVPTPDDIEHTFEKTRLALQVIDEIGISYDYIFRTNLSTWVNVPYLIQFVESIPLVDSDKIFSSMIQAVWNGSGPDPYSLYPLGNSLLIPKQWIAIIREAQPELLRVNDRTLGITDTQKPNSIYSVDDNVIGFIVNVWCEQHDINPYTIWKNFKKCQSFDTELMKQHAHLDYICVPFRMYEGDRRLEFMWGRLMQDVADAFETVFNESLEELYAETTRPQLVTFVRFGQTKSTDQFLTVDSRFAEMISHKMKDFDYSPDKIAMYLKDKYSKKSE